MSFEQLEARFAALGDATAAMDDVRVLSAGNEHVASPHSSVSIPRIGATSSCLTKARCPSGRTFGARASRVVAER